MLGKRTAQLIIKIIKKKEEGQSITLADHPELQEALHEDPKDAAVLLGLLTANVLDGTLDVKTERKAVLDSYNVIFGLICKFMATGPTSIALRGFVHNDKCISYWNVTGKVPQFSVIGGDYLFPNSLDVYLFFGEPTDVRLAEMNLQIWKAYDRRLPADECNIKKHDNVAKVDKVLASDVVIQRLDPDRANRPAPVKEPVFGTLAGIDYSKPVEDTLPIPPGAAPLIGLLGSLPLAKGVLRYHAEALADTERKALEQQDKAS